MKDDRLYLLHIRECLDRIARYASRGRETFFADTMLQDAILRNLQILAESAMRLSETLKRSRPEIDWRSIAGFRPPLRQTIEALLR